MEVRKKEWGSEEWYINNELYCFKKLIVEAGKSCSYHYHEHKDETFIVKRGQFDIIIDDIYLTLKEGHTLRVVPRQKHMFTAYEEEEDSVLIEISTHHKDADSIR